MKGKNEIWVEAQRETTNFDTVVFYRKLGFKEIGSFRDEKGEEYATMVRRL
jgi:hypothetical protein